MSWPAEGLRHFRPEEFSHPDEMDAALLELLDEIRERAGCPLRVTSDRRTEEEHRAIYPDPATRPNSPHLRGTAVDFKPMPYTDDTRLRVLHAITSLYIEGKCPRLGLEIANRHFHVDLDTTLRRPHFWLGESK